ncbi:MAG TPA: GNAT family N-acetyltransferase [Casimicrobiaceae bacterium]|nr:GNAT family N-acetyltransferase [Casimicrobiaceae bacterium]
MLPDRLLAGPVFLRHFVASDAPRVELLAGEREVAETTALIPHPYPEGAAAAWIATQAAGRASGSEFTYAVTEAGGPLVGAVGLRPYPGGRENLGYWIGRAYWGRGYATAAAQTLIALAFELLDLEALTASHLARNAASGRVMEKCGMRLLRTERREHRGTPEEFRVRGITRERWQEMAR